MAMLFNFQALFQISIFLTFNHSALFILKDTEHDLLKQIILSDTKFKFYNCKELFRIKNIK